MSLEESVLFVGEGRDDGYRSIQVPFEKFFYQGVFGVDKDNNSYLLCEDSSLHKFCIMESNGVISTLPISKFHFMKPNLTGFVFMNMCRSSNINVLNHQANEDLISKFLNLVKSCYGDICNALEFNGIIVTKFLYNPSSTGGYKIDLVEENPIILGYTQKVFSSGGNICIITPSKLSNSPNQNNMSIRDNLLVISK